MNFFKDFSLAELISITFTVCGDRYVGFYSGIDCTSR